MMNKKVAIAGIVARKLHANQTYDDSPFFDGHIVKVVNKLMEMTPESYSMNDDLVVATLLHDSIEDTQVTKEQIETMFGPVVADYVWRVTDEPGANRAEQKAKTYPKIAGHIEATLIKLADRCANVENALQKREIAKNSDLVPLKDYYQMYKDEYIDFRYALYTGEKLFENYWNFLDEAFEFMEH